MTIEWKVFPDPSLYDDDEDGEADVMLEQGPWFDWHALEQGGIVDHYACDGWLQVVCVWTGLSSDAGVCSLPITMMI